MSDTTEAPRPSAERPIEEQVLHHVTEDGVAWITLDRPDVKNAISPDQRDRVIALLDEASRLLAIRAVVLTATGDAFCTGADLRARHRQDPRPEGAPDRPVGHVARMVATGAQRLVTAVMDCEKPVIAAVNGTAAGIGAHLAFAADLVVAADSARFIEVFVRRGLVPDGGGAYLLPRIVGLHRAKELLFLGDTIDANEARELGLVNRVGAGRPGRRRGGRARRSARQGPDTCAGALEVALQPVARRGSHDRPQRRGVGPGDEHDDPRRQRGRAVVHRAAGARLPGLVTLPVEDGRPLQRMSIQLVSAVRTAISSAETGGLK